jgi:LDH2 family malate/lactate/ureidoglycolate dehydrogenase
MAQSPLSDEAIATFWSGTPRFAPELVRQQAESMFSAFGMTATNAAVATTTLLAADWRGIESHGVARIPYYGATFKEDGRIVANAELSVLRETPISVTYDANNGSGLVQGPQAMARCIEKATETGICFATVRASNHFGIAGYYATLAVEQGLVGVGMTNTGSLAAPTFGAKPMLGSNPIAVALPTGPDTDPIVLDMSTSTVAYGKVEIAQRARKPLANGWALDTEGYPTTDPFAFGAILPLGGERETSGHKGYGLGLIVDVLCGPLGGGNWSWAINADLNAGKPAGVSHFFAAWRVDAFRDPAEFHADLQTMMHDLRQTPVAPGAPSDRVLIPGEPEAAQERYNRVHGLPIRPEVLIELRECCREWSVPFLLDAPGLDGLGDPINVKSDH